MQKKYPTQLLRDSVGRQLLRETLAGYGRMNSFVEAELKQNLPKLTEEASSKEYAELYAVWDHTRKHYPDPDGEAVLEQQHIQYLIERRRLWDKIGQGLVLRKQNKVADP